MARLCPVVSAAASEVEEAAASYTQSDMSAEQQQLTVR